MAARFRELGAWRSHRTPSCHGDEGPGSREAAVAVCDEERIGDSASCPTFAAILREAVSLFASFSSIFSSADCSDLTATDTHPENPAVCPLHMNYYIALHLAEEAAAEPMYHGRCCVLGFICIEALRILTYCRGYGPSYYVAGMHLLAAVADMVSGVCAVPLLLSGIDGRCVLLGYLGPLMTLVFVMLMVDIGSFCCYLSVAMPQPVLSGKRSILDGLEATFGVWECALVASAALQLALLLACWRIYRVLRTACLYPPGAFAHHAMTRDGISVMEVLCEADDVEMMSNCQVPCLSERVALIAVDGVAPWPVEYTLNSRASRGTETEDECGGDSRGGEVVPSDVVAHWLVSLGRDGAPRGRDVSFGSDSGPGGHVSGQRQSDNPIVAIACKAPQQRRPAPLGVPELQFNSRCAYEDKGSVPSPSSDDHGGIGACDGGDGEMAQPLKIHHEGRGLFGMDAACTPLNSGAGTERKLKVAVAAQTFPSAPDGI